MAIYVHICKCVYIYNNIYIYIYIYLYYPDKSAAGAAASKSATLCNFIAQPHPCGGHCGLKPTIPCTDSCTPSCPKSSSKGKSDFSHFCLGPAKTPFCSHVVFPTRKHRPGAQMQFYLNARARPAVAANSHLGVPWGSFVREKAHWCAGARYDGAQ